MSVSRIILVSKAQYAKAYLRTELDEMDLTYFVLYNLKAIQGALADLKKYIHKKSQEKKAVLRLLRDTDLNDRQIAILQEILSDEKNIFSVNGVESRFGVSNQTARNDLMDLIRRGIMHPRKIGKQIQFIPVNDVVKKIRNLNEINRQ
ncbi:MAG TPA: DeoR family transcriptional regulator [Puia sp.]|jgi:Fic family protein